MNGDLQGALVRPVTVQLPHDRHLGLGLDGEALAEDELIARTGPTEGEFLLDDSARRAAIRVNGAPVTYEITLPLVPGWKPDSWWDVDPDDPAAVAAALARVGSSAWESRYLSARPSDYDIVGHYWVLNEDRYFTAADYKRNAGPYTEWDKWLPFDFKLYIPDLAVRGDRGWSTRRRRFLPPLARYPAGRVLTAAALIEFSVNGDDGPWVGDVGLVLIHAERCGISLGESDLTRLATENGDFVRAYIKGLLRVWITARIEGDDACFAVAREEDGWPLPWVTHVDRGEGIRHDQRDPATDWPESDYHWNDLWVYGFTQPPHRDDRPEAANLARRVLDEAGVRRCPGSLQLPYLLRPSDYAPWDNYKVGDELYHIATDDYRTGIDLTSGGADAVRAPRVAGITFRWSKDPAESTTVLTLEDKTFDQDNFIGGPG
jgi:hypothetical protein